MSAPILSRPRLALALLLNAPAFALAQSAPASEAPDYVVTASRAPQAAASVVRPVQVVTAQDIRSAGVTTVPELLRGFGLVEATSNGGMGTSSSVFIRGANSNHTVVLIDGVRVGSATAGTAALEALPLSLIERIEVLPGSASSLYGSDAIGGVIQIFTKSAQRSPGVNAAVTGGSQGTRQASASYAARLGDTELALGVARLHSDGINATTGAGKNPDKDGFDSTSGSFKLTQHLAGGHQLGLHVLSSLGENHYDNRPTEDDYARTRQQTVAAHWAGPLVGGVRSELRLGRAWDTATNTDNYPSRFETVQDQASWLNRLDVAPGQQVVAGLEWLRQSVDGTTDYSVDDRRIRAVLLGWRGQLGPLGVQADLRNDSNSQFGDHTTGQLAAAWQVQPGWRLRASFGTAFKAPTFNDLYYPWGGNPDLQPEKARNAELGSDWTLGGLDLGATLFRSRISNLIAWQPQPSGEWLPMNVGKASNTGVTLSAAGKLGSATRAKFNLTVQNPENADTGYQLQRRAREFAGLHLTHRAGALSLGTEVSYVGHRFDSATESAGSRLGGYTLLALFGSWQLNPDWALEARVNNATDKAYTSVSGYATPGRQGQLTLRWTPASL